MQCVYYLVCVKRDSILWHAASVSGEDRAAVGSRMTWSSPKYVVIDHKSVGSAAVGRAVRPDRA
eukprot:175041-Prymnesium_polylepis.2